MLNFTSRVSKSIWMLSCSTHGRVPSAFRTRVGQPTAQVIPGTWRVTPDEAALDFPAPSPGGEGVLGARAFSDLPQPGKPTARAASASAARKSLRIGSPHSGDAENTSRHVQKATTNEKESQVMTFVVRVPLPNT